MSLGYIASHSFRASLRHGSTSTAKPWYHSASVPANTRPGKRVHNELENQWKSSCWIGKSTKFLWPFSIANC
jgi:hypothetical protein